MLPHGVCVRLELCGDGGIIDGGQECARERRERENAGGRDTGRGCSGGSSSSHQSCTVEIPNADKYRSPKPPANPVTFSLSLSLFATPAVPLSSFSLLQLSSTRGPPSSLLPLLSALPPRLSPRPSVSESCVCAVIVRRYHHVHREASPLYLPVRRWCGSWCF